MTTARTVGEMLEDAFLAKHVRNAVKHFDELVKEFQLGHWEKAIAKGGKLIEAVLKALWAKAGEAVPAGRQFKADNVINQLPQKTALTADSLRLTVPRTCRVIYDIASNRGGRHDPDEIDPNEMDATVVVSNAQWILAELVRHSQKGATPDEVSAQVEALTRRRYPFFEDINGRLYSDVGKGAKQVGLMVLFYSGKRMNRDLLVQSIVRHGFTSKNAELAVTRLAEFVDDDGEGNLRIRLKGVVEAEKLMDGYKRNSRPHQLRRS